MKRILLVEMLLVSLPIEVLGAETTCAQDSLFNYLSQGTCTIEDKVFQFTDFSRSGGPLSTGITVVPLETPLDPGVQFLGNWSVDARDISVTQIAFTVFVNPFAEITESIKDNSLLLGEFKVIAAGSVSVQETKCLGGFNLDGSCDDGDLINLLVNQSRLTDSATFSPVHLIDVRLKITVGGGDVETGAASLQDFSVRFSEVPEPAECVTVCSALLGLVLMRFRSGQQSRQS